MRHFVLTFIAALVGTLPSSSVVGQSIRLPRFEDYRLAKTFVGKPAPANLRTHRQAPMFRTNIRRIAAAGPNFAGLYSVGTWGCGSDCEMVGVIDARTGRVHVAPFQVWEPSFRIDSALLISHESEIEQYLAGEPMFEVYEPRWYVWRRGRFVEIFRKQAARVREKNRPAWYETHP
jgi:hypothetical protein